MPSTELSPAERKAVRWPHPAALATELSRGTWRPTRHLLFIAQTIRDHIVRGNARLILTIPPRHGKSELCSVWLPVWFMALWPAARTGIITYGHRFSGKWGRKVRNILREHGSMLGATLSQEKKEANEIELLEGGSLIATGIGGTLTGHGLDLLIFDDPYKNRQEAESEVIRETVQEFWQSTARSRLEPDGNVVVIMQRWREDDLVGLLESEESGEEWTRIDLPAIAGEDDPIGRDPGDPLWPERYDLAALESIRRGTTAYYWASQYQQRPAPDEGAIFKRKHFRYWHKVDGFYTLETDAGPKRYPTYDVKVFQVADTAMKEKTTDDFTAVVTVGLTPDRELLVLDVFRERLEVPDQWPALKRLRDRWNPIWQGVEDRGSGVGIIQAARRLGLPVRPLNPVTDKVDRAVPASVWYENHLIFHPFQPDPPWLDPFEHELLYFPTGSHDDMVDALAYCVREVKSHPIDRSGLRAPEREAEANPRVNTRPSEEERQRRERRSRRKSGLTEQSGGIGGMFGS